MEIKTISYSSHFAASFRKLPLRIQKMALAKEILFRKDCFDARLKTHKLQGGLKNYWAFSIDYHHRIVFEFMEENTAGFVDIGDHGVYR